MTIASTEIVNTSVPSWTSASLGFSSSLTRSRASPPIAACMKTMRIMALKIYLKLLRVRVKLFSRSIYSGHRKL